MFFEQSHLGGQAPDLRVAIFKLLFIGGAHRRDGITLLEQAGHAFEHRDLPFAEDIWVDTLFGGELGDGLGLLQQFLHDLRLKGGSVSLFHLVSVPYLG